MNWIRDNKTVIGVVVAVAMLVPFGLSMLGVF